MTKTPKPNRYSENPHPPGTYAAAGWDLNRALGDLGRAIKGTGILRPVYWTVDRLNDFAKRRGL